MNISAGDPSHKDFLMDAAHTLDEMSQMLGEGSPENTEAILWAIVNLSWANEKGIQVIRML